MVPPRFAMQTDTKPGSKPSRWKRMRPWFLLLFGLALFYDLNPFYPLLLQMGVNAHLPIPQVVDETWAQSSRPRILEIDQDSRSPSDVTIKSDRGPIKLKAYPAKDGAVLGVVVAGGVGGAFDSPAQGLFGKLGTSLADERVFTVHLCFRHPREFAETVYDARAAVQFLNSVGIDRVILVGHSLGGAAMISAAWFEPTVAGVVPMSSQPYGADPIAELRSQKILVISGLLDVIEPPAWSRAIYKEAVGQKEIAYFVGSHNLHECADGVYDRLRHWILSCKRDNISEDWDGPPGAENVITILRDSMSGQYDSPGNDRRRRRNSANLRATL